MRNIEIIGIFYYYPRNGNMYDEYIINNMTFERSLKFILFKFFK